MANIAISVPDTVTAIYGVPTVAPIEDPVAVLRGLLGGIDEADLGAPPELVEQMLDGGLLTVVDDPTLLAALPMQMLLIFGAEPTELDLLDQSASAVVVVCHFGPGTPPLHEYVARRVAGLLARALARPFVIDLFTPRLVPVDDVFAQHATGVPAAVADLVLVPQSAGERGHWITTKGLGRFGLPELQVLDVPPPLAAPWTSVVTGLAWKLLGEFGDLVAEADDDLAFAEIPETLEVSVADIARAYGAEPDEDHLGVATVQFTFEPAVDLDDDSFLTVRAPDTFGRSSGEFHQAVVEDLFGAEDGEIRYTDGDDDDMRVAMETARGCLDVARARFEAGEFQHRTLLMVKYRLQVDEHVEFPWMFVTDWSDPERLHGPSAVDAEADPTIRIGRPVAIDADEIADWGVWVDGDGMVEGGWTNAVLQGDPPPPVPTLG